MIQNGYGPLRRIAVAACAAAVACGSGTTEPRKATRIEILAGNAQAGGVGSTLPLKVVVRTSDTEGPIGGVAVVVSAESGSGSASPRNVTTNESGTAEVSWTLGGTLGAQTLTVSSTGIPSASVQEKSYFMTPYAKG